MSKYKTSIQVDVQSVKELLPAAAYVHGLKWNPETSSVEVVWDHDAFKTPYDYPVEMTVEELKKVSDVKVQTDSGTDVPTEGQKVVAGKKRRA